MKVGRRPVTVEDGIEFSALWLALYTSCVIIYGPPVFLQFEVLVAIYFVALGIAWLEKQSALIGCPVLQHMYQ